MKSKEFTAALQSIASDYKTIYALGGWGAPLTGSNVSRYTTGSNLDYNKRSDRVAKLNASAGKKPPFFVFDCAGLIKAVLWGWNGDADKPNGGALYGANGCADVGATGFEGLCSDVSADFKSILPGELVFLTDSQNPKINSHVGVYIGGGKVIEATPSWEDGVQTTACTNIGAVSGLHGRKWNKHGRLNLIAYDTTPEERPSAQSRPVLKKGASGPDVAEMQTLLIKAGYPMRPYGADGSFGPATDAALRDFQKTRRLAVDGSCGPLTWAALLGE